MLSLEQVKVFNLSQYEHGADDVMVLATDGLWDVLSNEEVAEAISGFLGNCDPDDQHRQVHLCCLMCANHQRSNDGSLLRVIFIFTLSSVTVSYLRHTNLFWKIKTKIIYVNEK